MICSCGGSGASGGGGKDNEDSTEDNHDNVAAAAAAAAAHLHFNPSLSRSNVKVSVRGCPKRIAHNEKRGIA